MKVRPDPKFSVQDLASAIVHRKPKDHANLLRILRIILPAVGAADGMAVDGDLDDAAFDALAASLPASRLLDCLEKNYATWTPWMIEAVPELTKIKAYRTDYRRALVRCLEHAVASGLVTSSARGVAPGWRAARDKLAACLPCSQKALQARLDAGAIDFYGHSLLNRSFKATQTYFRTLLDAFNEMGRFMTGIGVIRPQDVCAAEIYGSPNSWYAYRKAGNPAAMSGYSRSRFAWEILSQLEPGWNLVPFPQAQQAREYGLARRNFAPLAERMMALILAEPDLKTGTCQNIERAVCRLLGVIHHGVGLDVHAFCSSFETAEELAFVLFAGYPHVDTGVEPEPEAEVRMLFGDEAYRKALLQKIIQASRHHAFQSGPCRRNPILDLYSRFQYDRKVPSILELDLKAFRIVGDRYLRVDPTQKPWITTMIAKAVKTKKTLPPSARARRKQAAAVDRDLWLKLVAARHRLAEHTVAMRAGMDAALANPELSSAQKSYARDRWAVAVRDELMIGMLLGFQLRKENIQGMRIGLEIFPDEHRISISPERAKASEWINRHFFDSGPFVDLKALLDIYLEEARPILLDGRNETPYLFLSCHKGQESRDSDGNLRVGSQLLPRVIRDACRNHFADILPPGVGDFNPHLARDLFARFACSQQDGGVVLAAQALANTPGVVHGSYLTVGRQGDQDVRPFLEGLEATGKTPARTKAQRRKSFREDVIKILGPDAPPRFLQELMVSFDRNS